MQSEPSDSSISRAALGETAEAEASAFEPEAGVPRPVRPTSEEPNPYLTARLEPEPFVGDTPAALGNDWMQAVASTAVSAAAWWESFGRRWATGELDWTRLWPWSRRHAGWRTRSAAAEAVDFRDRISVATWLVVLGLAASLLLQLPRVEFGFWALGSPVTIPLTGTLLSALFLALVAAAGAEGVVSVHPAFANPRRPRSATWSFWTLPMAITIIAVVLLPLAPTPAIQVLGLIVSGSLLGLAYAGLYATVERDRPGFRRARLVLDALAYGSALILFLFVYQTRTRSLLSGSLVALTAVLLAAEILRASTDRSATVLTYGGIIGLILGQVTWALNYWVLPGLTGGLLLLLIFYLLVGIAQHGLQGRLTQRVLLEFGVFGAVALVLIALVGPGF
jgi:hypothetical protein